jgi:hypothetical protein
VIRRRRGRFLLMAEVLLPFLRHWVPTMLISCLRVIAMLLLQIFLLAIVM